MGGELFNSKIKNQNRQMVYKYIKDHYAVSRQDIVYGLKLSLPTVISNIEYLLEKGLIGYAPEVRKTAGRSASTYTAVLQAKIAIGIYLTAHHMHATAVDLAGKVISVEKKTILFDLQDDNYLKQIGEIVEKVIRNVEITPEKVLGVGVSVPGLLSRDGEIVVYGETLNFTGTTRQQITKYIPYSSKLVHDSYAALFAETWNDSTLENVFYIGLNTNVGGSVMIRNQIYDGNTDKSGEIGHVKIVPKNGRLCYCGKRGCVETVCAASVLTEETNGNLDDFFEMLEKGNPVVKKKWNKYLDYLAQTINIIRALFDSTVIIGGYVGAHIDKYMDELCTKIDKKGFFSDKAKDYLRQCKYTVEDVGAGAALLYIDEFINTI